MIAIAAIRAFKTRELPLRGAPPATQPARLFQTAKLTEQGPTATRRTVAVRPRRTRSQRRRCGVERNEKRKEGQSQERTGEATVKIERRSTALNLVSLTAQHRCREFVEVQCPGSHGLCEGRRRLAVLMPPQHAAQIRPATAQQLAI